MAESLLPAVDVPEFATEVTEYDVSYKRSMRWDPVLGDFVRDGAQKVEEADGYEAFSIWCYKAAMTERYRCLAYPDSIGTEMEKIFLESDIKTVESMIERTITDALRVNPRTEYVRDFTFTPNGDGISVTFTVKGIEFEEDIEITI